MTGTTHNERDAQQTIEREWDASTPPSAALVRAVADVRDADATELRPLYEVVDADALDALVESGGATTTVEYEGVRATIRGDGRLEMVDLEERS